ncbi:retrovirus-related pol polyprotein from transposon TNT 1-94, partial [Tanacetum coccineum]
MLAEESRSKMILKQKNNDLMPEEKRINTIPINYVALNKLSSLSSEDPGTSVTPIKTEVPKELPKDKVLVKTVLKNVLRKLKGKEVIDNAAKISEPTPAVSKVYPIDPIKRIPRVKNKRMTYTSYLNNTIEQVTILREIVEESSILNPLDSASYYALKTSTSASGSQPSGNTKKDMISRSSSSTKKKNVEAYPRKVKSSLNKIIHVIKPSGTAAVQYSKPIANSDLKCVKCNGCMFFDNHAMCVLECVTEMNAKSKSKTAKKISKKKVWKPTGKVFTKIGYIWRPTSRTFTIVGDGCPLTRITSTPRVPLREPIPLEVETLKPVIRLVYRRKPWISKDNDTISKPKISKSVVHIFPWYLDSGCSKHMTEDRSHLTNFVSKFLGTVKFGNDHVEKIMGYGDYQIGNVTISRVYYMEGIGHNLFPVRQFCDSKLEVAFRQHTCFIRNLEDLMASSLVCLLSKASKTKSWLWHRRLSHLNFGTINHLAKNGLVRGLPKLKLEKDHLRSACTMGKSKKKTHKPKYEDTNQEILYLLHMDLCGPMRTKIINWKKYILFIVDDYSRTCSKTSFFITILPPTRTKWDQLFQPLFDELLNPLPSVDAPEHELIALILEVVAPATIAPTGTSSISVDQ